MRNFVKRVPKKKKDFLFSHLFKMNEAIQIQYLKSILTKSPKTPPRWRRVSRAFWSKRFRVRCQATRRNRGPQEWKLFILFSSRLDVRIGMKNCYVSQRKVGENFSRRESRLLPKARSVGLISQSASLLRSPCCKKTGRLGPLCRDIVVLP